MDVAGLELDSGRGKAKQVSSDYRGCGGWKLLVWVSSDEIGVAALVGKQKNRGFM